MSFTHPEILYGLFALLIPVIVHLFNFRRYKKYYFSNVALLREFSFETKRKSRLKHLLVMILRMLALAALVIAFAGPQTKTDNTNTTNKTKAIYIDNSFSMEAGDRNGRLFDHAIATARQIIKQSERDAEFLVLDNSGFLSQRAFNKDEALSKIDALKISPKHKTIAAVVEDFKMFVAQQNIEGLSSFLFSDFQKSAFDIVNFPSDSLVSWNFVRMQQQSANNILIDSCWIEEPVILPKKINTLMVRLRNVSEKNFPKAALKLFINGHNKSVAETDLPANGSKILKMQFSTGKEGWNSAYLEIEDYPISFDDKLYFSFFVDRKINVLTIGSENDNKYLKAFFATDSVFGFEQSATNSINYQNLSSKQLIILNSAEDISSGLISELKKYVNKGGKLFIFPSGSNKTNQLNSLLSVFNAGKISGPNKTETRVKGVKLKNSLFSNAIEKIPENADLPVVFEKFNIKNNYTNKTETLISLVNGDVFLLKKNYGSGILYLIAVPLDPAYSNLSTHSLFVPLMYGASIEGKGSQQLFSTIGKHKKTTIALENTQNTNGDFVFSLRKTGSLKEVIPPQNLKGKVLEFTIPEQLDESGIYQLMLSDKQEALLGLNYDRKESVMDFYSQTELEKMLNKSKLKHFRVMEMQSNSQEKFINSLENESRLWLLFIIFALLFLLSEILVLRLWK